ncbi:hypothetical protein EJB05_48934, partial [Eragrostis curvula]
MDKFRQWMASEEWRNNDDCLSNRQWWDNVKYLLDTVRIEYMNNNTLMVAAGVLNPEAHYKFDFHSEPEYLKELAIAIERMADSPDSAVWAISEFQFFKAKRGMFLRQFCLILPNS